MSRARPVLNEGDSAATLRRLIWQPLEPHLRKAQTVLISPDGVLNDMPFAALPGKNSAKYLIEEQGIAVFAVPQCLPEIVNLPEKIPRESPPPSMLALGEIDYDASSGAPESAAVVQAVRRRRVGAFQKWQRLPVTRGEVLAIVDSFHKAVPNGRAKVLTGAEATEKAFRTEAPNYSYLHLATHGFFAAAEIKSALAISEEHGGGGNLDWGRQNVIGFNPGFLSGVVLAGANKPGTDIGSDCGVLTALEVSELDLRKVELAMLERFHDGCSGISQLAFIRNAWIIVSIYLLATLHQLISALSACETGRGRVAGGEGVLGLQRAFQLAGAKTVVTSLWKVDDEAPRSLMEAFYDNYWRKEKGMLESLREAQLQMLREERKRGIVRELKREADLEARTPPLYWAAFILSGDWR